MAEEKDPSIFQIALSLLAAFCGVQNQANMDRDEKYIEKNGIKVYIFMGFFLVAIENVLDESVPEDLTDREVKRSRIIPTNVKLEVWKRDEGRCITCGAIDELHFDHILPFSKGGTSLKSDNVQLLCARHNLEKSAKIQ